MHPDSKPLTDAQRQKLCKILHHALVDLRMFGYAKNSEQVSDLADAFHNLPNELWQKDFSLSFFRDAFIAPYQKKYAGQGIRNYIAMVDEIIAMKD
ncbi:MAG TPA: hypothetical protein VII71_02835 [Verrucomicrobiae bacterium]